MGHLHQAILVAGLGFGDEGKGSVVDFLTRQCEAHTVVRFNGGPQAGHNVLTGDRRHHTFSQFGSGSFVPGVRTVLSRFVLVEPYALFNEARHLAEVGVGDALRGLMIDERCAVITPVHQAANRVRELARQRSGRAHGTCGMGIGEAMADLDACPELMLHARDLTDRGRVRARLGALRARRAEELREALRDVKGEPRARLSVETLLDGSWIEAAVDVYGELGRSGAVAAPRVVDSRLRGEGAVIFEGAQGVLLDETHGFHPHTTWSTTTFANAERVLQEAKCTGRVYRLGVLRSHSTRHGAGPLVTEDDELRGRLPEAHNDDDGWAGPFRVGVLDCVAARYAVKACGGVDGLAVTHLDRLERLPPRICTAYMGPDGRRITDLLELGQEGLTERLKEYRPVMREIDGWGPEALAAAVEAELGVPVVLRSFGPAAGDKVLSRHGPAGFLSGGERLSRP